MTNPFRAWTPSQIAGLPEAPDVVRQWEAAVKVNQALVESDDRIETAGNALAAEIERLTTWVVTLERENTNLRGLVERALVGDENATRWEADADRILAPVTGEDEQ